MIGLDYLAAGYLYLAASGIECKIQRNPRIEVVATDSTVQYDHSKSQKELDRINHDTISPYAPNVRTHVGGLMAGEVKISQNIKMYQEVWPSVSRGCLYYDSIKVELHVKPLIYIARDYPKGSCMYGAILEHEKKHIAVDRDIVNKYKTLITQSLGASLREVGYTHGPYPSSELKSVQEKLQKYIQDTVQKFSSAMSKERKKRQQEIDTLAEYERVQAKCRGQK